MTREPESPAEVGEAHRALLIRRSFVFRDLDPELVRRLARLSHMRRLARGTLLFQQGDEGDAFFGVVSGLIRISVVDRSGKELTLGLMEPGDVFGEIALLDGLSRTASAHAAEDSMLLVVERRPFLSFVEEEPRLARHLIELLCERLRDNTERLGEFAFFSLRARLARKLGALAIAHGEAHEGSVRITLKLSQAEIGQMLGVTREAVNRQLKTWAREGVLRLEEGRITVLAPDRLAAAARSDEA